MLKTIFTERNKGVEMIPNKLMSPKELSEYIGVKESSLAVWRTNKTYPLPYIKIGGLIRYRKDAVDKWIESRTKNTGGRHE